MSTEIEFPDGVDTSDDRVKFLPVMLAPELQVPQITGDDLSWVAGLGNIKGYQPITNTNAEGDYPGITLMSHTDADGSDPGGKS